MQTPWQFLSSADRTHRHNRSSWDPLSQLYTHDAIHTAKAVMQALILSPPSDNIHLIHLRFCPPSSKTWDYNFQLNLHACWNSRICAAWNSYLRRHKEAHTLLFPYKTGHPAPLSNGFKSHFIMSVQCGYLILPLRRFVSYFNAATLTTWMLCYCQYQTRSLYLPLVSEACIVAHHFKLRTPTATFSEMVTADPQTW